MLLEAKKLAESHGGIADVNMTFYTSHIPNCGEEDPRMAMLMEFGLHAIDLLNSLVGFIDLRLARSRRLESGLYALINGANEKSTATIRIGTFGDHFTSRVTILCHSGLHLTLENFETLTVTYPGKLMKEVVSSGKPRLIHTFPSRKLGFEKNGYGPLIESFMACKSISPMESLTSFYQFMFKNPLTENAMEHEPRSEHPALNNNQPVIHTNSAVRKN